MALKDRLTREFTPDQVSVALHARDEHGESLNKFLTTEAARIAWREAHGFSLPEVTLDVSKLPPGTRYVEVRVGLHESARPEDQALFDLDDLDQLNAVRAEAGMLTWTPEQADEERAKQGLPSVLRGRTQPPTEG